jgi:hypothetical protein
LLIGWTWSWRSSLPSSASVALVGASPLSAKQPLVGSCHRHPAPAFHGGIASWLLAQLALQAEPVFLSSSRGDSWDASRQIARHVASPISHLHDTSPQNWRSLMGYHGASTGSSSRRSLAHPRRSPRILYLIRKRLALRSSLAECCLLSRDEPVPKPIRLAIATRPSAAVRLLGTCSLGGWTEAPLVRAPSRHVQSAPAHDILRQPRRLPDLYAIVVHDERGQLPTHRG